MSDMYIKIDGIKGDATTTSTRTRSRSTRSASALSQPTGVRHLRGRPCRRARSSPPISTSPPRRYRLAHPLLGCLLGEVFKTAVVTMRRASKDQKVYMIHVQERHRFQLAPPGRRAVTMCADGEHLSPIRQLTLEYTPIKSDGTEGPRPRPMGLHKARRSDRRTDHQDVG